MKERYVYMYDVVEMSKLHQYNRKYYWILGNGIKNTLFSYEINFQ